MQEPGRDTVAERLTRLERENRRLKHMVAAGLVGLVAVLLMGQAPVAQAPRIVEAERFVLRDPSGNVRATLSVTSEGGTGLSLMNKDGTVGALLVTVDAGSALALGDPHGAVRIELGKTAEAWGLSLRDPRDVPRAKLLARETGSHLELFDAKGIRRVSLPAVSTATRGAAAPEARTPPGKPKAPGAAPRATPRPEAPPAPPPLTR
ncbi:MAG TPA: hypothetical protein VGW35_00590 [Methylomirabilota bacterium]|jgi:hypothetical protein|nr:hypothetical protein [Methylomirabilota bacterium]